MQTSKLDAFVFSSKAAISAVVALLAFKAFGLPGAIWAAVSAVIVTQPALHPSYKASLLRIGANLIGALVGAVVSSLTDNIVLAMAVGVLLTGLACHFAKMDDAIRPAFAAVVIVTMGSEPHAWTGSLARVLGVTLGCAAALVVGILFDSIGRLFSRKPEANDTGPQQTE